jgi:glycosyltransferase involved in cell wall biosynthesis
MKIAQIAPLYESVPPRLYGGTERVVSFLSEELVRQGHDVTLFASGDSVTSAKLISHAPRALRLGKVKEFHSYNVIQLEGVMDLANEFDVLHFHTDFHHFPLTKRLGKAHLTTLHGRLDIADLIPLYQKFPEQPLVSISDNQRKHLPVDVNWQGTVYHGLPLDLFSKGEGKGDYVAFLGRISPEKRPDRAIEIAQEAGMKLKIAAKIDDVDLAYYNKSIRRLMNRPHVEFVGEINEKEKNEFLGNAKALLFPIDWPEPFGMVMIEAMACGTPVIAYKNGSVPEIIDNGQSGFIVENKRQAVKALKNIDVLDRECVRQQFEKRFSVGAMTENYVRLYQNLIPKGKELKLLNGNTSLMKIS